MDIGDLSFDLTSLGEENRPDPETVYDLIVIGGDPAAMTAAVYAARKLLQLAVVTKDFGAKYDIMGEALFSQREHRGRQ